MTLHDWQQLPPAAAAREFRRRATTLLSPAQQRAVFATLSSEADLANAFARATRRSPLGGMPYVLKDLFDVAGQPTLAGSTFLPEVRPHFSDSTLVRALGDAGAVLGGKTHLHEFAYGITGENPHYGDCEHPRFPGRTTGGSSSGSAAAVAAGIVPFAIGTDTGGSIRVPAAFCGLFGLRLTPEHPFSADAFPLAPSFDTAGWFAATAADLLAVNTALLPPAAAPWQEPRGCFLELPGLDPDVAAAFREAATAFASPADALAATTLLEGFRPSLEIYNTIVAAEAWSLHRPWADAHRERYDPAVWQRLQRGRTLPRADYERALVGLTAARLLWAKFFLCFDFLILPTTPCGALAKADCTLANRSRLLALTAPASLGGLPVLTVPVALPSGLTTGLQIVVNHVQSPVIPWVLHQVGAVAAR